MLRKLLKIRLSQLYAISFVFFLIVLTFLKPLKLTDGQIALFSVTGLLFGFYFGPILDSQKSRVQSLIACVRQENMAILDILAQAHLLPAKARHALKIKLKVYVESIIDNPNVSPDNPYYDELLHYSKQPEFKDNSVMDDIYQSISSTQDHRNDMQNLYASKLFSHEWLVMVVLFAITLFFILQTDYGHAWFFRAMLAILCAGLVMLMAIAIKYATLTHKKAKSMWDPMHELLDHHFEDITAAEVKHAKANLYVFK